MPHPDTRNVDRRNLATHLYRIADTISVQDALTIRLAASVIAMDAEFNDRILRIGDDMLRHVPPDEDCSKAWRALP